MEMKVKELPLLDLMIKKDGNKIITDIYCKPTDTQHFLHFKSHHPKSCIQSIPYTLARRMCTIIKPSELRTTRLKELRSSLIHRGYPITLISKGFEMTEAIPISILRQTEMKEIR